MMGPSGPSNSAVGAPAPPPAAHGHDEGDAAAQLATVTVEHAQGSECPIAFTDADAVLARVGDIVITACDVVLADRHDRREGLSMRTPQQILRSLVDDALLADAARMHALDRDPTVERRIREVLAEAIVQSETRARSAAAVPDDAALRSYYDAHTTEFTFDERVHLREIVVASEQEARDVLRDAQTTAFETLLTRSRSPDATRDQGDLGLVPRGGNDRVSAAIATAAFALTEPQAWVGEPIRVESNVPVGRHGRMRREITWHAVQYLGSVPERVLSFDEARDLIRHRLLFGRVQTERTAVMQELTAHARSSTEVRFDMRAIGRVRLRRDPPPREEHPPRRR
jgi:peptidyl-prolyl cis-trans isomerase C